MRIDCHYSRPLHWLVIALHLVAMLAVLGSSLLPVLQGALAVVLLLLALRAHRDYCADSSTRIRAFLIWDKWAELSMGRDEQGRLVRVALPRVSYASEYLMILHFAAIDAPATARLSGAQVLLLVPGMVNDAQYSSLLGYLRFGIITAPRHGVSMVSRGSSSCSG